MPARSVIDLLPDEAREWLQGELVARRFSGYIELTDAMNAKLAELGLELTVSKSMVHRFGQQFEDRIEALRRATLMSQTMVREVGDDEGAMNDALIRMVQEKLFSALLDGDLTPKAINGIARAAADLARASVTQKKHAAAERERAHQKLQELEAEAKDGKSHLDPETLRRVREEIYGIT